MMNKLSLALILAILFSTHTHAQSNPIMVSELNRAISKSHTNLKTKDRPKSFKILKVLSQNENDTRCDKQVLVKSNYGKSTLIQQYCLIKKENDYQVVDFFAINNESEYEDPFYEIAVSDLQVSKNCTEPDLDKIQRKIDSLILNQSQRGLFAFIKTINKTNNKIAYMFRPYFDYSEINDIIQNRSRLATDEFIQKISRTNSIEHEFIFSTKDLKNQNSVFDFLKNRKSEIHIKIQRINHKRFLISDVKLKNDRSLIPPQYVCTKSGWALTRFYSADQASNQDH